MTEHPNNFITRTINPWLMMAHRELRVISNQTLLNLYIYIYMTMGCSTDEWMSLKSFARILITDYSNPFVDLYIWSFMMRGYPLIDDS